MEEENKTMTIRLRDNGSVPTEEVEKLLSKLLPWEIDELFSKYYQAEIENLLDELLPSERYELFSKYYIMRDYEEAD